MYKTVILKDEVQSYVQRLSNNAFIPFFPDNTDYQVFLDDIIEHGAACLEGDIPAVIQAAADQKFFNRQLDSYKNSVERLSQYILSEGREEVRETVPTGEQKYNEKTGEMEPVLVERVTHPAVEPLEATVEVTELKDPEDPSAGTVTKTVRNPLIVQDEEERAAAQAIVDATPQAVKDAAAAE